MGWHGSDDSGSLPFSLPDAPVAATDLTVSVRDHHLPFATGKRTAHPAWQLLAYADSVTASVAPLQVDSWK